MTSVHQTPTSGSYAVFPFSYTPTYQIPPISYLSQMIHPKYCGPTYASSVDPNAINTTTCRRSPEVTWATKLSQKRSTQLKKSFTIEAILGLKSEKIETKAIGDESCYGPMKEIDLRRNRVSPYTCPVSYNNQELSYNKKDDSNILDLAPERKSLKSKRVRTIFTSEQLERLENEFERQQYMVGQERVYLASDLQLTEAQVKVWFQNRRIKWRKENLEMQQAKLAKFRGGDEQPENEHEIVN